MTEIFEKLKFYFEYPFVRYALIVGLLIALCSSLLGVTLVLKRFSFIGDGLSHVAFGAMAVAIVAGLTNRMIIILPVTVISAVLLLRTGQNTKIKGDAAVAMKTVRAAGPFSYFKNPDTQNEYFAVLIADITACCAQGIEFRLDGDYSYPEDYPDADTEIIISGVCDIYKEGTATYMQLLHAKYEVNE